MQLRAEMQLRGGHLQHRHGATDSRTNTTTHIFAKLFTTCCPVLRLSFGSHAANERRAGRVRRRT
eukprot:4237408-Prymnesium_polylepis.2